MNLVKKRLASTPAAWKVVANQVMVSARTTPAATSSTSTHGWATRPSASELIGHIKRKKIKDVVFVTGDIHTFVAGDVRLNDKDKRLDGHGVRGRLGLGSQGLGEGGGGIVPAADPFNPKTPQAIIDLLKDANPWVEERGVRPSRVRAGGGDQEGLPLHPEAGGPVKTPGQ